MTPRILVTGATGNTGRAVLEALAARGVSARAAVRDPTRAGRLPGSPELVTFDFQTPETFAWALEGITGLFLLRPPAIADMAGTLNPLIDAAAKAGVSHVVFLSVAGAESNRFIPHRKVEDHLMASGLDWTLLRPGFFAQNLADAYREDIRDDNRLFVPCGKGRLAWVDVRDLGEVAALAFLDPVHRKQAWTLTGAETADFLEVAEILTRVLERPIRYQPASIPAYVRHLRRRGLPWMQAAVLTVLHVGVRRGRAATIDPKLEQLLGRKSRTIEDYVHDYAALWRKEPAAGV